MGLTEFLAGYITQFIQATGYISVVIGMIMESMIFPIPSEAIMPFAGFLIATGKFSWFGVIGFSTAASIIGSLISYGMGYYGGEPFIKKFGKYLLLDLEDYNFTKKFFQRYGKATIFISRFIPIVRHLISLPAGMAKMNLGGFLILTALGAGLWNTLLTVIGFYLKQNWERVMEYSKIIDILVLVVLISLIGLFIYRHLKKRNKVK